MENKQEIYGAVENIIQEKLIDNMELNKQNGNHHNNILQLPTQQKIHELQSPLPLKKTMSQSSMMDS